MTHSTVSRAFAILAIAAVYVTVVTAPAKKQVKPAPSLEDNTDPLATTVNTHTPGGRSSTLGSFGATEIHYRW
jgi:hypothetical protein